MPGKYDPPDNARLLATFRRTPSVPELMVAAAEAQFPPKVKHDNGATYATPMRNESLETRAIGCHSRKRGRKAVVTPERIKLICELLARGETERGACIRAGVGSTAWSGAKRVDSTLRDRIASARDDWARLRHQQHAAALFASQSMRAAGRKALKPTPTKQAKWMVWHLATCVPLNFAAIPEEEIASACKRCSLSLETWRRQENAFGLLKKVYAKRAAIRGEQPQFQPSPFEDLAQEWPPDQDDDGDEY
jgi:hypothetical protein